MAKSFLEQQEDAVRTAHPALEGSLRRLPSLLPLAITFTWSPSRSLRLLHGEGHQMVEPREYSKGGELLTVHAIPLFRLG